jgi:tetratricopeptide (TPR) repeat protein/ssDNA-binding Zn-finger/Zn-ribbon topoisomerase 1
MSNFSQLAKVAIAIVLIGLLGKAAWDWYTVLPPEAMNDAQYVGGSTCAECHQSEQARWHGSHHDRAMELATDESVLGDFNDTKFERLGATTRFFRRDGKYFVNTEGPDGEDADFEIKYTFGIDPIQQYMVEFPKGRVQVLRVSWDTQNKRWFEVTPPDAAGEHLKPDDPLYWTNVAQNWNTTCAECHSTNLQKGYDPKTDTFHTTYSEIDVSCEECHGPGSAHVSLARSRRLFWDRNVGYGLADLKSANTNIEIEACAKCHSRRVMIHEGFRPGRPLLDYFEPSLLTAGLYHDDGQIQDEVYEYASFLESKMYSNNVRCTNCHDPHSLKPKFSGNQLCTQCHQAAKYDTVGHHHHAAESVASQCVACHMPTRNYMVIHARRDHSLRVPRPDLSVALGTPNACNDCHTKPNETAQWAADAVVKWYGNKRPDDPRWAPAFAAGNRSLPEGDDLLAEVIRRKTTPGIVRATAVSLIGRYPSESAVAIEQLALTDSNPMVRMAATRALGGISMLQIIAELAPRLTDPIRAVRMATARRLVTLPLAQLDTVYRESFLRALAEYRASQQLDLERAHPHINLGWLDRQLNKQIDPERVDSHADFEWLKGVTGDETQAADELRAAIRMEPYLTGPRTELANSLANLKENADEVRRLRKEEAGLLERDAALLPDNGDVEFRLGLLRFQLGQFDEAAAALASACRLAPNEYDYRMTLALLDERRYEQGSEESMYRSAKASLDLLQQMRPNDPRAVAILKRLDSTRAAKRGLGAPATGSP